MVRQKAGIVIQRVQDDDFADVRVPLLQMLRLCDCEFLAQHTAALFAFTHDSEPKVRVARCCGCCGCWTMRLSHLMPLPSLPSWSTQTCLARSSK